MPEPMRLRLERAEDAQLAPWALRSAGAARRYPIEDEGRAFDYRTEFQRDRDRIVYCRAFRRLRQKAQTGILPSYEDHRRNRLTRSIQPGSGVIWFSLCSDWQNRIRDRSESLIGAHKTFHQVAKKW